MPRQVQREGWFGVHGDSADQAGGSACAFGGGSYRAGGEVVVDHAAGLHQCVERCRAKEVKASAFEFARKGYGLGRRRGYVAPRRWGPSPRCPWIRPED
jgi:hypothetical protein